MNTRILVAALFILVASFHAIGGPVDRMQANNILIRTNRVIGHAHMSVKKGGNYTGDLAKAVRHERTAKAYFKQGEFEKAIYHSRLARIQASDAIKANKIKLPMDASFSPAELQLFSDLPTNEALEQEAAYQNIQASSDKDLMTGNLDLELNK